MYNLFNFIRLNKNHMNLNLMDSSFELINFKKKKKNKKKAK